MHTDERGSELPIPVMEYGRVGDHESRSAKLRWLIGGMLIYLLSVAISGVAEAGATLALNMLSVADSIVALFSAGLGVAVFVAAMVGLVAYASTPGGGPALFRSGRPVAGSAVVICVVLVAAMVLLYAVRVVLARFLGVASFGRAYQLQSIIALLKTVLYPIGMVVALAVARKP